MFLLDTNIVSSLMRDPNGRVAARIADAGEENAARRASPRLTERMELILSRLPVLPFAAPADEHYGDIRAALESRGRPIGANDMLIAAHARALDWVLVTDNSREFARVPGLRTQNWLR